MVFKHAEEDQMNLSWTALREREGKRDFGEKWRTVFSFLTDTHCIFNQWKRMTLLSADTRF